VHAYNDQKDNSPRLHRFLNNCAILVLLSPPWSRFISSPFQILNGSGVVDPDRLIVVAPSGGYIWRWKRPTLTYKGLYKTSDELDDGCESIDDLTTAKHGTNKAMA
jgi:hypothetical protein